MVKPEILYTIQCDRCGELLEGGPEYWYDVESALESAKSSEWLMLDNKHYCPECYVINEDDKEEIKEPIPRQITKLKDFLRIVSSSYFSFTDNKECFYLEGYVNELSETSKEMMEEIAKPFSICFSVRKVFCLDNKLIITIKK